MERNLARDSTVCASARRRCDNVLFDNKQKNLLVIGNADEAPTPARLVTSSENLERRKEVAATIQVTPDSQIYKRSASKRMQPTLPLKMTVSRAAKRKLDFPVLRGYFPEQPEGDSLEEIFSQNPTRKLSDPFMDSHLTKPFNMANSFENSFKRVESNFFSDAEKSNFFIPHKNFDLDCDDELVSPSYDDLLSKYSSVKGSETGCEASSWDPLESPSVAEANQFLSELEEARCTSYLPLLASPPPKKQLLLDASDQCANYQSLSQNSLAEGCESETIGNEDLSTFNERLQSMSAEEVIRVVRKLQQQEP